MNFIGLREGVLALYDNIYYKYGDYEDYTAHSIVIAYYKFPQSHKWKCEEVLNYFSNNHLHKPPPIHNF